MSVFDDQGKTKPRGPSLRGVLMQDVSNGTARTRVWPGKRKKRLPTKTKQQMEWFRQAQWATKYMAPDLMAQAAAAVKGTPLLPRDILTMMFAGRLAMFSTVDGRKVYPQVAYNDVSESLDVITQVDDNTLVRRNGIWVGEPYGGGGSGDGLIERQTLAADAASVTFTGIPTNFFSLDFEIMGRVTGAYSLILCRLNGDTGANYERFRWNKFGTSADSNSAYMEVGQLPGSADPAGQVGISEFSIAGFLQTTFWKPMVGSSWERLNNDGNLNISESFGGTWESTSAVTDVLIYPASGNFKAGTSIAMYGRE